MNPYLTPSARDRDQHWAAAIAWGNSSLDLFGILVVRPSKRIVGCDVFVSDAQDTFVDKGSDRLTGIVSVLPPRGRPEALFGSQESVVDPHQNFGVCAVA